MPLTVLVLLALVPWVSQATAQPFYTAFFARIVIYAIAACALNIALGFGGLVSFGHSLFLGIGAYAVGLCSFYGIGNGWIHLVLCLAVGAGAAVVTGIISLRTTGIAFIMITLSFAQMGYFLFVSLKKYGGDDGMPIANPSRFGPIDLSSATQVYVVAYAVLVIAIVWLARLRVSPFGMVIRASQQNARRVQAIGFPVQRYQLLAYVISGVLCAVAGLLLANLNAFSSPSTMAWSVSGELIVIVVVGGLGTIFGPLMGTIIFLGSEEILKSVTEHWMLIFGPLVVIIALLGKGGVIGLLQRFDTNKSSAAE